jgi:hypothetical protein
MAMDAEDTELAEDVAGLVSDRIGEAMSLRGDAEAVNAIVTDSHADGNVAVLYLQDGGRLRITVEVHR